MKKIFSVLLLGTALSFVAACDDKKAEDKKSEDKKDAKGKSEDKKAVADEKKADEAKVEEKKPDAAAVESTGSPECDELIKKTMCSYDKAGAAVPAEAKKGFEDSVKAWKDGLKNDATKQATIDACKASLDAAKAGFEAQGC